MPRADLQGADAETEYFYVIPQFKTREDMAAFIEVANGLLDKPLVGYEKKRIRHGLTIVGQTIMEVFKVPNRSYHADDIKALLEERHFSPNTAGSYLPQLIREGFIYRVGPQTYAKRNDDPASPIRTDKPLDPTGDGHLAGLVEGEACGCGCGDAG